LTKKRLYKKYIFIILLFIVVVLLLIKPVSRAMRYLDLVAKDKAGHTQSKCVLLRIDNFVGSKSEPVLLEYVSFHFDDPCEIKRMSFSVEEKPDGVYNFATEDVNLFIEKTIYLDVELSNAAFSLSEPRIESKIYVHEMNFEWQKAIALFECDKSIWEIAFLDQDAYEDYLSKVELKIFAMPTSDLIYINERDKVNWILYIRLEPFEFIGRIWIPYSDSDGYIYHNLYGVSHNKSQNPMDLAHTIISSINFHYNSYVDRNEWVKTISKHIKNRF
jgi:hypothetical protein